MASKEVVEFLIRVTTDAHNAANGLDLLSGTAKTVAASVATATGALIAMADAMVGLIDKLNTLSKASGLSLDSIEALRIAAVYSGKELEQLVPPELAKRVAEAATGTGEAARGFAMMGIQSRIVSGELQGVDEVLRASIDALSRMEDPTQRAAAATFALGEQGKQLLSAFSSVEQFDAYVQLAERSVYTSDRAASATANWQRAMGDLSMATDTFKSGLTPVIELVAYLVRKATEASIVLGELYTSYTLFGQAVAHLGRDGDATFKQTRDELRAGMMGRIEERLAALDAVGANAATPDLAMLADNRQQSDEAIAAMAAAIYGEEAKTADAKKRTASHAADHARAAREAAQATRDAAQAAREAADEEARILGLYARAASARDRAFGERLGAETAAAVDELTTVLSGKMDELTARAERAAAMRANPVGGAIDAGVGAIMAALGPVGPAIAAISELPALIQGATDMVAQLPSIIESLPDLLGGLVEAVIGAIFDLPGAILTALVELPQAIAEAIRDALRKVGGKTADRTRDMLEGLYGVDLGGGSGGGAAASGTVQQAPSMSQLTRGMQMSRGGTTVNVVSSDPRVVVDEIRRATGPYGLGVTSYGGM